MTASQGRRRRTIIGLMIATVTCVAILSGSLLAGSSFAAVSEVAITKTNNANHTGVFASTESVPASATFPWVVTYKLTIFGGTAPRPGPLGPLHFIDSITDSNTTNIGTCAALVHTTIKVGQTETCTYTVTLTHAQTTPIVNTASLVYDGAGKDAAKSSSTVNFEPRCPEGRVLVGEDLCCPPGTQNPIYCEPLHRHHEKKKCDEDKNKWWNNNGWCQKWPGGDAILARRNYA